MNSIKLIDEARRVLQAEADAVRGVAALLDERFVRAVDMIGTCGGRVIVTGMGKSGLVGKKIAATLASTGTPAFSMHPAEASHGDLGMCTRNDVILAISNSGETAEVVSLLPFIKRFEIRLITITANHNSTLARSADVSLDIGVREEACPMGIVPTSSTTATLALGDALAVAMLLRKGFKEEDFAKFHPSGTLGKKLLTKVADLMHAGSAVPVVAPDTLIADTVIEMSAKRLGFTTVQDSGGRLLGVLSDGDLRRGLQDEGPSYFQHRVADAMNTTPKTIGPDELATSALSVMQKHSITSIVVVGDGRAVGVVHIHDILRHGIA